MECFESFFVFIKDAIGAACICQTRREGRVLQTVMNGKIEEDVKKIYINKSNDSDPISIPLHYISMWLLAK